MKKMKTGDVKRFKRESFVIYNMFSHWAVIGEPNATRMTRDGARKHRGPHERIARILSIGPKYVTVRISK